MEEIKTTSYRTLESEAEGEITEKKSRFICNLYHIESEEEIKQIVDSLKKKHYQARHVCHAAILGDVGDILKYSDDGEPSGTAGRPMLDILKGQELTYTLACVTRYFGGVLLGTGGLVRAYSQALISALENARIVSKRICNKISFSIDYQSLGKLKFVMGDYEAGVIEENYGSEVEMRLSVPDERLDAFIKYLNDLTGGNIEVENEGRVMISEIK